MSYKRYRSDLERILTIMLTRCMRADGTVPHYTIIQQVRPLITLDQLNKYLEEACIETKIRKSSTRAGKYYLASDILNALEVEQKKLDALEVGISNPSRSNRMKSFLGDDDDAAGGVA